MAATSIRPPFRPRTGISTNPARREPATAPTVLIQYAFPMVTPDRDRSAIMSRDASGKTIPISVAGASIKVAAPTAIPRT